MNYILSRKNFSCVVSERASLTRNIKMHFLIISHGYISRKILTNLKVGHISISWSRLTTDNYANILVPCHVICQSKKLTPLYMNEYIRKCNYPK